MKKLTSLKKVYNRLQYSLFNSVENFRKGNDHIGLEFFYNSIDDIESLLYYQQYVEDMIIEIDKILLILETLYASIECQDLLRMIDILEFEFYPLAEKWNKECYQ